MIALARAAILAAALGITLFDFSGLASAQPSDAASRDLPAVFEPFEFLIGAWKGQGVPLDNPTQRVRGWTETHTWAWVFQAGNPVGMTVAVQRGRIFSKATLRYEPGSKQYVLEAAPPGASAPTVRYNGTLDSTGKLLTLERVEKANVERLTLRANSNYIRYTLTQSVKPASAVLYQTRTEVGLTKAGESFAAGSSDVSTPKCIVTGGAATLSVFCQGQSFPICCTGCRDEFLENPEKYLKKLAMKSSSGGSPASKPKASRVSRSEDVFSGDTDAAPPRGRSATVEQSPALKSSSAPSSSESAGTGPKAGSKPKATAQPAEKLPAKAVTALRLAQNLEKSGKSEAALKSYKQIVNDFPKTASARVAAERIKAIEGR
jgi:hypothetical protein